MSFNETFALLFHSLKLVLMLPIIIYNGMSLAYIFGDVTSGISKRCFGASWSLYITAIFYLANSFGTCGRFESPPASYIFGKCVEKKWMSRTVMCCAAFVMQLISFLFFIFYKIPNDSKSITDLILTIVMVILLSFGDSVWESQPPAILQSFYGLDRERNAAMANYKMWQSLGWCGQFVVGVFFLVILFRLFYYRSSLFLLRLLRLYFYICHKVIKIILFGRRLLRLYTCCVCCTLIDAVYPLVRFRSQYLAKSCCNQYSPVTGVNSFSFRLILCQIRQKVFHLSKL